ncbi:MAG: hypothetical protein WCE21_00005 [Candidatus Babeliales bacterium]
MNVLSRVFYGMLLCAASMQVVAFNQFTVKIKNSTKDVVRIGIRYASSNERDREELLLERSGIKPGYSAEFEIPANRPSSSGVLLLFNSPTWQFIHLIPEGNTELRIFTITEGGYSRTEVEKIEAPTTVAVEPRTSAPAEILVSRIEQHIKPIAPAATEEPKPAAPKQEIFVGIVNKLSKSVYLFASTDTVEYKKFGGLMPDELRYGSFKINDSLTMYAGQLITVKMPENSDGSYPTLYCYADKAKTKLIGSYTPSGKTKWIIFTVANNGKAIIDKANKSIENAFKSEKFTISDLIQ